MVTNHEKKSLQMSLNSGPNVNTTGSTVKAGAFIQSLEFFFRESADELPALESCTKVWPETRLAKEAPFP